uniref:Uncharacterized protein n=1 Tax=Clastoptera arizonana TaxID=38151 RepID=A0A1B6CVK1_9HEMI
MAPKKRNKKSAVRKVKIITAGDGAVGKTSLLVTYSCKRFPVVYTPTICDSFAENRIIDGQEFFITFWDTAGQEGYERLRSLSYPETDCVLLCYSIDNKASFYNIEKNWIAEIRHYCPDIPVILVATKVDQREEDKLDKLITHSEGDLLAQKLKLASFMECSALKNEGVNEVITEAIKCIHKNTNRRKRKCSIL